MDEFFWAGRSRPLSARSLTNLSMLPNPLTTIDPKILGERLRVARRARGFTQEQAADALGYARTTVVAIEKGERRVTTEELIQFAHHYGRKVSELVGQQTNTQPLVPQFRSGPPTARTIATISETGFLEAAEYLEGLAGDYRELEDMCGMSLPKDYPPIYRVEDSFNEPEELGEEIAQEERARLGLGDAPITDLRALLEEAVGLRIFYYPMASGIAGVFACNDELGGCVGINSRHPSARGNFSLGHEYAHFLTTRYQADVALDSGGWGRLPTERFADSFAGHFLMPRSGVSRRFSDLTDARKGSPRIADLVQLAHFYGVSVQAMCLRLEELKRVPSGTWDKLKDGGFRPDQARMTLGIVKTEENREQLPQRYVLLAHRAFESGLLSEGQLAKKLRTDRVGARLMLEKVAGVIDDHSEDGYVSFVCDFAAPLVNA
jgi:Zn-dependent peptidase ImmA (M78 family)/DNA-binding XRE family transcriptional regulator